MFESSGYAEAELEFGGSADLHVELRGDLWGHILGDDAGGVVSGRKEIEGEAAFGVRVDGVARAGSGVDYRDGGSGDPQVVEINDGAMDGAGGGILSGRERGQ
jgi:hypothetical protein